MSSPWPPGPAERRGPPPRGDRWAAPGPGDDAPWWAQGEHPAWPVDDTPPYGWSPQTFAGPLPDTEPPTPPYAWLAVTPDANRRGPPWEVVLSFWLWMAVVVVGAAALGPALVQVGPSVARAALGRLDRATSGAVLRVGAALGFVLLRVVLELVFAVLARRGRGGARVALAVLAGVDVAAFAYQRVSVPSLGPAAAVGATVVLVAVVAVGLSFRPAARAWFRAERPRAPADGARVGAVERPGGR